MMQSIHHLHARFPDRKASGTSPTAMNGIEGNHGTGLPQNPELILLDI